MALLTLSVALCWQMGCAAGQVLLQPEVEKEVTRHSTCYAVQVGAYEKRAEAVAMMIKLAQTFSYPMALTQVDARDNVRWRLRVLASSRDEALKASERLLAEQGIHGWMVPMSCKEKLDDLVLGVQANLNQ